MIFPRLEQLNWDGIVGFAIFYQESVLQAKTQITNYKYLEVPLMDCLCYIVA